MQPGLRSVVGNGTKRDTPCGGVRYVEHMSQRALIIETAITIVIWAVLAVVFPDLPLLAVIALGIPLGYLVARGGPAIVRALRKRRQGSVTERTHSVR